MNETLKIAIFSPKGGSGKTFHALNLCAHYQKRGLKVGLIDLDPQASSLFFAKRQKTTPTFLGDINTFKSGAIPKELDVLILDLPPSMDFIPNPKEFLIVMPFLADVLSVASFMKAKQKLEGHFFIPVLNRMNWQKRLCRDVLNDMKNVCVVADCEAAKVAASQFKTVFEDYSSKKVARQIDFLAHVIEQKTIPEMDEFLDVQIRTGLFDPENKGKNTL